MILQNRDKFMTKTLYVVDFHEEIESRYYDSNLSRSICDQSPAFFQFSTQPAITCSKLTRETLEQGYKICSKFTIQTPERRLRSGVFIVNFEHTSHLVLVFLLLTLSR